MRPRRLALAILVALSLAPSTFLRSPPAPVGSHEVRFVKLAVPRATAGPLTLGGAWEALSEHQAFGGFSALAVRPDGKMLLASDAGRLVAIDRPDRAAEAGLIRILVRSRGDGKFNLDLEAMTRDPETGRIWAAYENSNRIIRFNRDMEVEARRKPAEMRDWGVNSGPEALARLPDGRFIALEEQSRGWGSAEHRGVLFDGDPTRPGVGRSFTLLAPEGYRPVDATALDEDRVLILFRALELGFPPRFGTAIGILELAALASDKPAPVHLLAVLAPPVPADNYEGIAVTNDGGETAVWLVSDDNFMRFQRTLVLKFVWQARQKARR